VGQAQHNDVVTQLHFGSRYLDFRVAINDYINGHDNMYTMHSMFSKCSILSVIDQIFSFVVENEKEIIIMDFQHLHGFESNDHVKLTDKILTTFNGLLCPHTRTTCVTLNELWQKNERVIVLYNNTEIAASSPFLWPRSRSINSKWFEQTNINKLMKNLHHHVQKRDVEDHRFFVAQAVITPNETMVAKSLMPAVFSNNPRNLLEAAHQLNPFVVSAMQKWRMSGLKINIVMVDAIENHPELIEEVMQMNLTVEGSTVNSSIIPFEMIDTNNEEQGNVEQHENATNVAIIGGSSN